MGYTRTSGDEWIWVHQPREVLTQANPISGDLYPVLAAQDHVRLIQVSADVTWTVQPNPLQVWITVDGEVEECYVFNPVSATVYSPVLGYWDEINDRINLGVGAFTKDRAFLFEGRRVAVSVETTGGTVSQLRGWVEWARKERV